MHPVENADKVAEPESNYNSVQTASQQVPGASKSNLCFIRKKNILQEIPSSICVFFSYKISSKKFLVQSIPRILDHLLSQNVFKEIFSITCRNSRTVVVSECLQRNFFQSIVRILNHL